MTVVIHPLQDTVINPLKDVRKFTDMHMWPGTLYGYLERSAFTLAACFSSSRSKRACEQLALAGQ
jgi:hypothetical protein